MVRDKNGRFVKGHVPIDNNKGRKFTKEHRQKLSMASKGKKKTPFTKEHRRKLSGENSHLWKGGVTHPNLKERQTFEAKLWKKMCLERDNFTCQKTGQTGGDLVVHHINNFAEFPELRTSLENGITLSRKSHIAFHKKYGFKNNTREQIIKFLGLQVKNNW